MTTKSHPNKKKLKAKSVEDRANEILTKVRPYIQMHGGDVELLSVKRGVATLKVYGACVGCGLADMTYNKLIGGLLRQDIPEIQKVVLES